MNLTQRTAGHEILLPLCSKRRGDLTVVKRVSVLIGVAAVLFVHMVIAPMDGLAEPYRHQRTGLVFPDSVNTLRLFRATDYEPLYAGVGTGISYRTDAMRADVFLYDRREGPIPDGTSSKVVNDEFDGIVQEIYALEAQGTYRNVSVIVKKETISVGGRLKFLHGVLAYELNNIKCISHIYLAGYNGLFMRLRVVYARDAKVREEPNLAAFLTMISDITKTTPQP